jgi:hypothetical protein
LYRQLSTQDNWNAWQAAYEAGAIAMKEKAANLASDLWEADENICASPMCSDIPAAIRALAISGAEESTPATK